MFADLVEPLGFDTLWTFEHHFSPYIMLPNPQQMIAFMAGRTQRIDFGTNATILPWHNPVRLAENLALLQHMLGPGRKVILGTGRGLARREFNGLMIEMSESRELYAETIEILRLAFHNEFFSYNGKHYKLDNVTIRPRPLDPDVVDNAHGVWTSKDSMKVVAGLGLNPLALPSKSLAEFADDIHDYNEARATAGFPPARRPIAQVFMVCSESEQEAREAAEQYVVEYGDSVILHYEMGGEHFNHIKGYEQYRSGGESAASTESPDGRLPMDAKGALGRVLIDDGVIGTPKQCVERIDAINQMMGPSEIILVNKPGSMPMELAEKGLRLYAKEVLPQVHKMECADVFSADASFREEALQAS
jgi:alkanesulfonate monooxygenase SsuD/methylene tetrahydromethanopterin reductase-like flavin-dependent oxidoreductase (luciferase family)